MNKSNTIILSAIFGRLRSELKLKIVLMIALNFWVYVPYFFLQRHHFFEPMTMPASCFDRLVPFCDKAVWIYLSIFLLMPVGPFLMSHRRQIARYAIGIVAIGALADLIFIFWPTACPRPDPGGTITAYRKLITIDNSFHAFPSLHAAFALFSTLCAGQVLRELQIHLLWRNALWLWTLLILLATLLTKQHVVADVGAGTALAFVVHSCAFYQWNSRPKTGVPFRAVPQPNSTAL